MAANQYEALTDARGRIVDYFVHRFDEAWPPDKIGKHLDGGERVTLRGIEYDLTEKGNLIHPDVELHDSVHLGHGVLLGAGVKFEEGDSNSSWTSVADHALIRSNGEQHIGLGAHLGPHAIFRGKRVGKDVNIGPYVRIGEDSSVGSGAVIEDNVKILRRVAVGQDVNIGYNTKIGDDVHVESDINIGHSTKILPTGTGKGGISILVSRDIEPHATVTHNVVSH